MKRQQHEGQVLVVVQHAVAGPVALEAMIVQAIQQRQQLLEVLKPCNCFSMNGLTRGNSHSADMHRPAESAS